jgi:chromate transporter
MIIFGAGLGGLMLHGRSSLSLVPLGTGVAETRVTYFSKIKVCLSLALLAGFQIVFSVPIPGLGNDSLGRIFITFSGMSLMLFGGGFVFIPMIQEIVVEGLKWVTQAEFTSAIAMGQITPGPILISAAFIGYKIKGFLGAFIATVAIFFPSALLMVNASLILDQIKGSQMVQAALKGIRAAVVGMVFAAAVVIGQGAGFHWVSLVIFMGCMLALVRFRMDLVWIIPLAGLVGVLLY